MHERTQATNIAAAFAAGALANLAYVVLVAPEEPALPLAFFASHLCLLSAAHVGLAVLCAGRAGDRLWAVIAFTVPIAGAAVPLVQDSFGLRGLAGLATLLALSIVACSLIPWFRGAPLVAAVAGGIVSNELVRFRREIVEVRGAEWSDALVPVVWLLGGFAVVALVGRAHPRVRVPAAWSSWAIAAAAVGVGTVLAAVDAPSSGIDAPIVTSTRSSPPVVLIVLDTVRADHLPIYGYERDTMPALARFATTHGVVVRRAYANGSWSLPSHASMFTGLHPSRHGAHEPFEDDANKPPTGGYRLPDEIPTVAELLAEGGYWTAGVSANFGPLSDAFGLDRGFQRYHASRNATQELLTSSPWRIPHLPFSPGAVVGALLDRWPPFASCEFFLGVRYRRAQEITDEALAVVEAAGERPFFLFVNYLDAHQPYAPPGEYRNRFPGVRWRLGLHGIDNRTQRAVLRGERPMNAEEFEHVRALYDGELAYLDHHLERLLAGLARHEAWSDMLVVITSDHGEALGEHGLTGHGISLYEEMIRVPLVLKPGNEADAPAQGSEIAGPMESVDVFATILDHAGVPAPEGVDGLPWGRGRTYAQAWLYWKNPLGIVSPRFDRERRAVVRDGWKLIESSSGEVELYQLDGDAGELRNLADTHPEWRLPLAALLGPRRPGVVGRRTAEDAGTLERLRALGYVR